MIRLTSTPEAPWYVVPADNKWFPRTVVAAKGGAIPRLSLRPDRMLLPGPWPKRERVGRLLHRGRLTLSSATNGGFRFG
jgi:polyphosphate kinase 2 PPK2